MAERPVIVVVDDEPAALAAMLDTLTRRFGGDYRVAPYLSALAALEAIARLKADGDEIALVIADQWMPEITGNEFLGRVRAIEPTAKRALLVAWGDHAASPTILQACAMGQLDNYLYKPWTPAEVHLYPLVSEFLAEWTRIHRPGMELIHIVGDEFSPRSNEIRELLDRNGVPFGFHPYASSAATRLAEQRGVGLGTLPTVFLLDGSVLADPTDAEIMDAIGESPDELSCDVAVIGSGPAGLTSAVSAGSEGLRTLVVERHVFARDVTRLQTNGVKKTLTISDGRQITATAVILTTGAAYRRLEVPGVERFVGRSVFYTTSARPGWCVVSTWRWPAGETRPGRQRSISPPSRAG
jgi:thioredoxin reductase (NADPH)